MSDTLAQWVKQQEVLQEAKQTELEAQHEAALVEDIAQVKRLVEEAINENKKTIYPPANWSEELIQIFKEQGLRFTSLGNGTGQYAFHFHHVQK